MSNTTRQYDVAIIGGGIVGLATAMALARQAGRSLIVLDAENRLAAHQTGHNSGVIHSGLYYKPGSSKARLCVEGREELYRFCQKRGIPHERCGKLVVATSKDELSALHTLEARGRANGLEGLRRLGPDELREFEPHARGFGALLVPDTGIVDFTQVAEAYGDAIRDAGHEIRLQARLDEVRCEPGGLILVTTRGELRCRLLVNCGGLCCDRIARMAGLEPGVRIVPFRGEYHELVPNRRHLVRNLIYPVPDPRFPFLGVHFTRMIHGGVEAGPNAVLAFKRDGYHRFSFSPADALDTATYRGFWRLAAKYWRTALGEFHRSFSKGAFATALKRLIPELEASDLQPAGCGIRAQAVDPTGTLVDDFHLLQADRMLHVLNAPSPAATASIAIGRTIADTAFGHLP